MTPSPTHDSEDWLDEITVKLFNAGMSFANTKSFDYSPKDGKKAILAHYARPTKAQLELAAKVATLEQKIYMMESTYLKPEDVEAIIGETEIEWKKPKAMTRNDLRREQRERLSKLNREEESDAKT